jgi:putative oxidoreductase
MLRNLFQTNEDIAGLIVRLALGIVILPHGLQKLLGLFGGAGFTATKEIKQAKASNLICSHWA